LPWLLGVKWCWQDTSQWAKPNSLLDLWHLTAGWPMIWQNYSRFKIASWIWMFLNSWFKIQFWMWTRYWVWDAWSAKWGHLLFPVGVEWHWQDTTQWAKLKGLPNLWHLTAGWPTICQIIEDSIFSFECLQDTECGMQEVLSKDTSHGQLGSSSNSRTQVSDLSQKVWWTSATLQETSHDFQNYSRFNIESV
jgi:hypothetical protein